MREQKKPYMAFCREETR